MPVRSAFDLIQSVSPPNGATNVASTAEIKVRFVLHMDPASLAPETFRLLDPSGQAVPRSVTYHPEAREAVLVPHAPLEGGTRYQAALISGPSGIKTVFGDTLAVDFVWNFQTSETSFLPPPVLLLPHDRSKTAKATPDLSWQPVPGAAQYEVQISRKNNFATLFYQTVIQDTGDDPVTLTPQTPLQSNLDIASIYYWRVRAIDEHGQPGVWSEVWQFNNATYTEPGAWETDVFEVVSVSPAPRSIHVGSREKIAIVFSEDVDPDSIVVEVYEEELS